MDASMTYRAAQTADVRETPKKYDVEEKKWKSE